MELSDDDSNMNRSPKGKYARNSIGLYLKRLGMPLREERWVLSTPWGQNVSNLVLSNVKETVIIAATFPYNISLLLTIAGSGSMLFTIESLLIWHYQTPKKSPS